MLSEGGVRVLLVEDDPRDAATLQSILRSVKQPPFHVTHVTTLFDACIHLDSTPTDLVILDLGLPDASDLSGLMRLHDFSAEIPIIVLTGKADEQLALSALHQGAEDYLVKGSMDRALLIRSIRYSLERHHGIRELARLSRELQVANSNLEKLALIDPLTELLNRRGLQQALSKEVQRVQRDGIDVIALLVDIDDFKKVNDTLGHAVGDVALKEIARRLRDSIRAVDYVGRLGGDEFLLLLPQASPAEITRIAERFRLGVATTLIQHNTGILHLTASIAATLLKPDTPSIDELLSKTHTLLQRTKKLGKNRVSFDGAQFDDTDRRVRDQSEMCAALARGERLISYQQPILRLSDETAVAYEFLSRYFSSTMELPDHFFRVCSERNILTLVDHQCLRRAISSAVQSRMDVRFHVNLFPSTLIAVPPEHLIEEFSAEAPTDRFCIEVSEQQILGDPSYLIEPISRLRAAGLQIAIDDVGFGNSCIESLVLLEPDVIKIDKRCVTGLADHPVKRRQLERYMAVGRELAAEVVAEGIETRKDLEILQDMGVEFGQGFLWGFPVASATEPVVDNRVSHLS